MAKARNLASYLSGLSANALSAASGSISSGFGSISTSNAITTTGAITGGSFVIGSADINENDLEAIDGVTAGTIAASKVVTVDTNKDVSSFRNLTATGTITAANLDISTDVDIDGTLEADAITVDSVALNEYIADTVGAMVSSNTETNVTVTYEDGDNTLDFSVDFSSLQTALTFGISNTNAVKIDSADVADDEYARFTSSGLESRSTSEVLSDIGAVGTGAVTSITSVLATDVKIGEDDETKIDFEDADQINFYADNTKRVTIDATGLTVNSGSIETATIDYTDGDNAMTIADGGKVTFAAGFDVGSDASGDILYHNGTSYVRLAKGSDSQVLTLASGVPSWAAASGGGGDVVDDSSPSLGGDLDVNGNSIVSLSNADINITPNGTGKVNITSTSTTNTLQLTSADASNASAPDLVFDRQSSSPADNDYLGKLDFKGKNSAAETLTYGSIIASALDVTDGTEDGEVSISNSIAGADTWALRTKSGIVYAPLTGMYSNLLGTFTASNDATLDTGVIFSDTYDVYDFVFKNIMPVTNDVNLNFWFLSTSNTDLQLSGYHWYNSFNASKYNDSSQTDTDYDRNEPSWRISGKHEFAIGNESGEGYNAHLRILNARGSYYTMATLLTCGYVSVDGYQVHNYLSSMGSAWLGAVGGGKIEFSSGNISSGSFAVYGIKTGL